MCLWTSSYTRTTSAFRYTKGTFWCLLSNLRDKNLKFTWGRFMIFLDCICTLQYKNTTELKYWKLLLPYCYLKKKMKDMLLSECTPLRTLFANHLFSLDRAVSLRTFPRCWDKSFWSCYETLEKIAFPLPPHQHVPTSMDLHLLSSLPQLYASIFMDIADFHFNTLSSLDEQTASTRREPLWVSCNMLSTEKQKLNLKAAGEPLTTHSCSK